MTKFFRHTTDGNSKYCEIARKRLTLNDIIDYIKSNKNMLSQTELVTFEGKDTQVSSHIATCYKKQAILKSLPRNLNLIFSSIDICVTGVLGDINTLPNVNLSFFFSLLTILHPNFSDIDENDQRALVSQFIDRLYGEVKNRFNQYNKMGWVEETFWGRLNNINISDQMIRYVSDFMHINIFVIDLQNDVLLYHGTDVCIVFKKNIFLVRHNENHFEPAHFGDGTSFSPHNSMIIKKILQSHFLVEHIDTCATRKNKLVAFVFGEDDLDNYIPKMTRHKIIEKANVVTDVASKGVNDVVKDVVNDVVKDVVKDVVNDDTSNTINEVTIGSTKDIAVGVETNIKVDGNTIITDDVPINKQKHSVTRTKKGQQAEVESKVKSHKEPLVKIKADTKPLTETKVKNSIDNLTLTKKKYNSKVLPNKTAQDSIVAYNKLKSLDNQPSDGNEFIEDEIEVADVENIPTIKVNVSSKLDYLKSMAVKLNIPVTHINNKGIKVGKTKLMLVTEINECIHKCNK